MCRTACQDGILFRPADLMELLIRFYQVSGYKPSLRLCAKLRADAFDWTTAIHTFQQSIPISPEENNKGYVFPEQKPEEIDFEEKEKLINHSELLADGIRYTLFTGIFSGHGQDLSSGKTIWPYLLKHHHALCGGATGNPYLSGSTADQTVNNCTLAAWAEAFCAQMAFADFTWASEELIRIVRNGIDDCLNQEILPDAQRINSIREDKKWPSDPARLYARIARAVSFAYSHAVSLTEKGIMILYLLPGRYMVNIQKQMMMLLTENDSVEIHCKKPVSIPIDVYLQTAGSLSVNIERKNRIYIGSAEQLHGRPGCCIHMNTEWQDRDVIRFVPDETIICEEQHHQGISFLYRNRLLCMRVIDGEFARAICGIPEKTTDGRINVLSAATEKWKIKGVQPADIPVLPDTKEEPAILTAGTGLPCSREKNSNV